MKCKTIYKVNVTKLMVNKGTLKSYIYSPDRLKRNKTEPTKKFLLLKYMVNKGILKSCIYSHVQVDCSA